MSRMIAYALTLSSGLAFCPAGPLLAGEQYVDATGFAVSGYDVVSYFAIAQSKVGQPQQSPLPGSAAITAVHNGATFAFATKANRAAFLANPAAYLPQYDGHCAYGVTRGGKVPGNPTLWRIIDGKLYLNITRQIVGYWERDISGNLTKSDTNWVGLEPDRASGDSIPGFTSAAPLKD